MRNKNPKLLLALLFAHQTTLQILITFAGSFSWVCWTCSTGTPTWSICGLAVKCNNWLPITPWKTFLFPIQNHVAKEHWSLCLCTVPTWWIWTLFPLLLLTQSTQVETRKSLRDPGKKSDIRDHHLGKTEKAWGGKRLWQSMWRKEGMEIWNSKNTQKFGMPWTFALFQLLNIIYSVLSLQRYLILVLITVFMAYWAVLCIFASELTKIWLRFAPCLIEKSDLEWVCLATVASDAGNPHKRKCSIFCV